MLITSDGCILCTVHGVQQKISLAGLGIQPLEMMETPIESKPRSESAKPSSEASRRQPIAKPVRA